MPMGREWRTWLQRDESHTDAKTNKGKRPMSTRVPALSRRLAVGLFLAAVSWCPSVDAGEGFFAAVALERSLADVDYEKSVEIGSPFSAMTARDDTRDPVDAVKAAVGYRRSLSSRLYLAAEVEGAFYLNGETGGFLQGTGEGDTDVWPGMWTIHRRGAVGLNARLGYVPDSLEFLGTRSGRSTCSRVPAGWTPTSRRSTSTGAWASPDRDARTAP